MLDNTPPIPIVSSIAPLSQDKCAWLVDIWGVIHVSRDYDHSFATTYSWLGRAVLTDAVWHKICTRSRYCVHIRNGIFSIYEGDAAKPLCLAQIVSLQSTNAVAIQRS